MSFYGKVLYEFRKLFSHFKFENYSNNNDSSLDFPSQVKDGTIEANDNWDTLKFKMGNRWLGLVADDTDGDTTRDNTEKEDGVTLYHMGPGDADPTKGLESIKYIPKNVKVEEEVISQLMPGERFEIWTTDFDAAGHNVETKSEKEVLKLPALKINGVLQTNNNINIFDDKYIDIEISKEEENENIKIEASHVENDKKLEGAIYSDIGSLEGLNGEGYKNGDSQQQESWENELPNDTEIWQLKMGGLIKVPAIQYDDAGHAKYFTEQYFRLPSYEDDKGNDLASELNIVKDSITSIEKELEIIKKEDGILPTLESYGGRIKSLEDANFLSTERYETEIGDVNELFIESANYVGVEKTLVGMIGDQLAASNVVEAMLKEYYEDYEDDSNKLHPIANSMASMAGIIIKLIKQNKELTTTVSGATFYISNLQEQINELKKNNT